MNYKEPENYIENKGDILASRAYHPLFPEGRDSISNTGIKSVDNKEWEIYWINKETEEAYYGTPAEGLGLVDCMILKEDTREFLPEEIEELEKHVYSLGGMFSGNTTFKKPVKIEPIKSKWKELKR